MTIEAIVTLGSENAASVGRDRIRLLQAVAREGSITAGAKAAGLSYNAAWDALDAMTNLFGQPLLETRTGGPRTTGSARNPSNEYVSQSRRRRLDIPAIRLLCQISAQAKMQNIREIPRFTTLQTPEFAHSIPRRPKNLTQRAIAGRWPRKGAADIIRSASQR